MAGHHVDSTSISSLLRVEQRFERVPITPEQVSERMRTAAGIIQAAIVFEDEHAELSTQAKRKKKLAEAKHAEADRLVLDARDGTMAAPYLVLVERHPSHPSEMIMWRVPDGMAADELLVAEMPENEARIVARKTQGCVLIETRAMSSDELETARIEAERRQNPELPFETTPAETIDVGPAAQAVVGAGKVAKRRQRQKHADRPAGPASAAAAPKVEAKFEASFEP